jgi:hypothetical protein
MTGTGRAFQARDRRGHIRATSGPRTTGSQRITPVTTGLHRRISPGGLHQAPQVATTALRSLTRKGRGRGGLGEVRVFLVPLPAAAKDCDAEEVQQRQAGVHRQAHARGDRRDQDGEQLEEPWEHGQGKSGTALPIIQPLPQQVGRLVAYSQMTTRMTAIATRIKP